MLPRRFDAVLVVVEGAGFSSGSDVDFSGGYQSIDLQAFVWKFINTYHCHTQANPSHRFMCINVKDIYFARDKPLMHPGRRPSNSLPSEKSNRQKLRFSGVHNWFHTIVVPFSSCYTTWTVWVLTRLCAILDLHTSVSPKRTSAFTRCQTQDALFFLMMSNSPPAKSEKVLRSWPPLHLSPDKLARRNVLEDRPQRKNSVVRHRTTSWIEHFLPNAKSCMSCHGNCSWRHANQLFQAIVILF